MEPAAPRPDHARPTPPPRPTVPPPPPAALVVRPAVRADVAPPPTDNPTDDPPADLVEHLQLRPWPDPVLDTIGHDPRSAYVERFWLPILGPSAVWLLRRVARELEASPTGASVPVSELAQSIGVGTKGGRNSPFHRTLDRLVTFGLAQHIDPTTMAVRHRLPPLSKRQLQRLPAQLRDEHEPWVSKPPTEAPVEQLRLRARALALSLLELGETREDAERQLHRWRFHPAIAYEALRWATERHRQRRLEAAHAPEVDAHNDEAGAGAEPAEHLRHHDRAS